MNILLWIVQVALALFCFAGGQYKVFQFAELAKMPQTSALSHGVWTALGVFEMTCAILLVVPAVARRMPVLTPLSATALGLEALTLAVIFAQYSLALNASNPLPYVIVMAVLAMFVAYGRFRLRPLA